MSDSFYSEKKKLAVFLFEQKRTSFCFGSRKRMSFLTSSVFNSSHDRIWKNVLAEEGKKEGMRRRSECLSLFPSALRCVSILCMFKCICQSVFSWYLLYEPNSREGSERRRCFFEHLLLRGKHVMFFFFSSKTHGICFVIFFLLRKK